MKEIKAFIHRNRVTDVVHALEQAGFQQLTVIDSKGLLSALDSDEQEYSVEIGDKVITEVELKLVCDDARVNEVVQLVSEKAQTGQATAGWLYVLPIDAVYRIGRPS